MAESTTILVAPRSQYGRDVLHPANDAARILAEIAGTTTLTPATLKLAEQLGHTVVIAAVQAKTLADFR